MNTRGFFGLICLATFTVDSNSQRAWIYRPLELVFLAYEPPSYGTEEKRVQLAMFRSMLNSFIINDTQTRVAVVIHEGRPVIVTGLTANTMVLDGVHFGPRKEMTYPSVGTEESLKLIRENVFADARSNAKKAVLLSYYKVTYKEWRAVEAEAKELRKSGIDIFVAARRSPFDDPTAFKLHISGITGGDPRRHSNWSEYSSLLKHMRKTYYQCYQELCKYVDGERQSCTPDWYGWNCSSSEKPTEKPLKVCELDDCERTCNLAWPWTREECKSSECGNGSTITVNRSEPNSRYDHWWYEHCIPSKPIKCPPCPSTALITTPGHLSKTTIVIGASVGAVLILGVIIATIIIVARYIRSTMRDMVPADPPMPRVKVMPMPLAAGLRPPPPPVPPPPPTVPPPAMPGSMPPIFPVIQGEQGSSVSVKYVESTPLDVRDGEWTSADAKANLLGNHHPRSDQPSMNGSSGMNGTKKPTTSTGK